MRATIEIYTGEIEPEALRRLIEAIDITIEQHTGKPTCTGDPGSADVSIHDSDTGEAIEHER